MCRRPFHGHTRRDIQQCDQHRGADPRIRLCHQIVDAVEDLSEHEGLQVITTFQVHQVLVDERGQDGPVLDDDLSFPQMRHDDVFARLQHVGSVEQHLAGT